MEIQDIKALESDRDKILEGMKLVYKNLIAFKKRMNSDLIVYRNGQIVRITVEDLETLDKKEGQ